MKNGYGYRCCSGQSHRPSARNSRTPGSGDDPNPDFDLDLDDDGAD